MFKNILIGGLGVGLTGSLIICWKLYSENKDLQKEVDGLKEYLKSDDNEETEPSETRNVESFRPTYVEVEVTDDDIQHSVEVVEGIEEQTNNVKNEREARVDFLESFNGKHDDSDESVELIEVNGEMINPNTPRAFSIYIDSMLEGIMQEAQRPDLESYREWTRNVYDFGRYETAEIDTRDVIEQIVELFDYNIHNWGSEDNNIILRIKGQLEEFFGEESVNVENVSYGNFIVNSVYDIQEMFGDISMIEVAAIMLQQVEAFDEYVTVGERQDIIVSMFDHAVFNRFGNGAFGLPETYANLTLEKNAFCNILDDIITS